MLNRTGHFWETRYHSTGFPVCDMGTTLEICAAAYRKFCKEYKPQPKPERSNDELEICDFFEKSQIFSLVQICDFFEKSQIFSLVQICDFFKKSQIFSPLQGILTCKMVEQLAVQEAIATPHPLQQPPLNAVVEKPRQIPGGNTALPKDKAQADMLNAGKPPSSQKTKE